MIYGHRAVICQPHTAITESTDRQATSSGHQQLPVLPSLPEWPKNQYSTAYLQQFILADYISLNPCVEYIHYMVPHFLEE